MFRTLSEAGINIDLIATSGIRITCMIDAEQVPKAAQGVRAGGVASTPAPPTLTATAAEETDPKRTTVPPVYPFASYIGPSIH